MNQKNERHKRISEALANHYNEAAMVVPDERIFALCLQGSQNYLLDTPESDIDSKCLIIPSFKEIVMNKKPISTTHVRVNEEHIDLKDIRNYWACFKKQNINFVEILFTDFFIVHWQYTDIWDNIRKHKEDIARLNPYAAVKTMKGVAMEKYHALEHLYPSKVDIIAKYGFDGKQLSHLLRIEQFIQNYVNDKPYADCLIAKDPEYLIAVKRNQMYSVEEAREIAAKALAHITEIADEFCNKTKNENNLNVEQFLDEMLYSIMKTSMKRELMNCD